MGGGSNMVKFNSSKTQCTIFSLKHSSFEPNLLFNNINLTPNDNLYMLGLLFSSDLTWKSHITQLAKSASQKLGVLFRFRNYFNSRQLLTLYVGTIRPCMEYCSHVWGHSPGVELLDRVESKAFRLIASPPLLLRCLLFPVAGMLPHSLYFTNIILVTVQESWLAVCPHHWHALAQRDSLNRLIVMQLSCLIAGLNATHGLSFLLHLYCGITFLSRCFLPNLISKNSNVILIDILCSSISFRRLRLLEWVHGTRRP